jgi:hypothetical protein
MKRSGAALICMTLWWVMPFFISDLIAHPLFSHFHSHLLYLIVILVSVVFAYLLGVIDARRKLWERSAYWGKYILLCGAYAAQMIVILVLVLSLDEYRLIGYFGRDPESSVGMLFIPSIAVYVLLGAILGLVLMVTGRITTRKEHNHDR